ncbi:acetyl-coenzyme A transporter 1-like protein, partial [Leptotrombidium deliense]
MYELEVSRKSSIVSTIISQNEEIGIKGDYVNICLLLLLYILQGIPLGLVRTTIPMILASNNVSYNKQAIFSIASYPYAIKLLWAPIVDSIYCKKIGRRK